MWSSKKPYTASSSSAACFASLSRSPYQETTTEAASIGVRESHRYTLNSLWSCWYGALSVIFQVYIISKSVNRFTGYLSLSWPKSSTPYTELNAYVILVGCGVILLPFFAISAIMRIGNSSNDGTKVGEQEDTSSSPSSSSSSTSSRWHRKKYESLGKKSRVSIANANSCRGGGGDDAHSSESIYANFHSTANTYSSDTSNEASTFHVKRRREVSKCNILVNVWKHMLPIAAFLHVLSALAFLFPRVLMESQLIVHGFLPKSDVWKTEMDCVLDFIQDGRLELLHFLDPINETEKAWLKQSLASASSVASVSTLISTTQIVSTDSSTSPLIVQATRSSISHKLDLTPGSMSLELVNLIIALLIILVRYPSIFWRCNKPFATLMSLQIFFTSLVLLVIYSSFCILYKVHIVTPDRTLLRYPNAFTLTTSETVFLAIFLMLTLIVSSGILCMYGHSKLSEWRRKKEAKSYITHESGRKQSSSHYCWGFAPHLAAFLFLIVKAVAAVPLMYDLIVVYCGSLDSVSLVGAFAIAFYLLEYIILWLFLTLKHSWNFNFHPSDMSANSSTGHHSSFMREAALLPGQKSFTLSSKGESPLLVIDHGRTYQVREYGSKAAIRSLASKSSVACSRLPGKAYSSLALGEEVHPSDANSGEYWLKGRTLPRDESEYKKQNTSAAASAAGVNTIGGSRMSSDRSFNAVSPDNLQSDDIINETRRLSWLRRSARNRTSTSCSDGRGKNQKNHSSLEDTGISETESFLNQSQGSNEYCSSIKKLVRRDDTTVNSSAAAGAGAGAVSMLTSLSEEREDQVFLRSDEHMMKQGVMNASTHQRHASMNGDYELLVDSNQHHSTTGGGGGGGYSNEYDVYGVRRLFSQMPSSSTFNRTSSTLNSTSCNYQSLRGNSTAYNRQESTSGGYCSSNVSSSNASPALTGVHSHNNSSINHSGYRGGRIGSISSESSTSPEKLSETSSGIHSGCPSITSEKRCASAENLNAIAGSSGATGHPYNNNSNINSNNNNTAYIHSRASFRTSSLQRGPIQVRCPKVTLSSQAESPFSPNSFEPLPPPMAELDTMIIRRMKQQANDASESSHSHGTSFTGTYGGSGGVGEASFTSDMSDIDKLMSQPLPPPPPETLTSVSLLDSGAAANVSNFSAHTVKPIAPIAPQLPSHSAGALATSFPFASQTVTGAFLPPPVDIICKDAEKTEAHLACEFERQIQKHFL